MTGESDWTALQMCAERSNWHNLSIKCLHAIINNWKGMQTFLVLKLDCSSTDSKLASSFARSIAKYIMTSTSNRSSFIVVGEHFNIWCWDLPRLRLTSGFEGVLYIFFINDTELTRYLSFLFPSAEIVSELRLMFWVTPLEQLLWPTTAKKIWQK